MWGNPPFRNDARAKPPRRLEIQVRNLDAEHDSSNASSGLTTVTNSMGSLLRLFRSDFFDAFMAVTYLYRYRETRGVHDYLCNELYVLADADLEIFMPQVCNLLVHHCPDSPGLERFVMDKCASSMHFSVQVYWFLQAAVEDAIREKNKTAEERCRYLRTQCETAAVNGSLYSFRPSLSRRILPSPASSDAGLKSNGVSDTAKDGGTSETAKESDSEPGVVVIDDEFEVDSEPVPVVDSADLSRDGEGDDDFVDAELEIPDVPLAAVDDSVTEWKEDHLEVRTEPEVLREDGKILEDVPELEPEKLDTKEASSVKMEAKIPTLECIKDAEMVENGESVGGKDETMDESPESGGSLPESGKIAEESLNRTVEIQGDFAGLAIEGSPSELDAASESINEDSKVKAEQVTETSSARAKRPSTIEALDNDAMQMVRMKQERFDYFQDSLAIVKLLVQLSLSTRDQVEANRMSHLVGGLHKVNDMLFRRMCGDSAEPLVAGAPAPKAEDVVALGRTAAQRSIHLPLTRADAQVLRILRVLPEESVILTSRTRCPFLLYVEVLPSAMTCSDRYVFCEHMGVGHTPDPQASRRRSTSKEPKITKVWNSSSTEELPNSEDITSAPLNENGILKRSRQKLSEMTPRERQRANVRATIYGDAYTDQPDNFAKADREDLLADSVDDGERKARQAALLGVFGELWDWKEERLLRKSPFAELKESKLMSFIIKAGDDLRQEQLAIQLIKQFDIIFKEEDVDVFLKPFTVMSVCSDAGLVQVMPDSVSVHSLKGRTPNFRSLLDYFERAYGEVGTSSFRAAQRRFIRSMAGYSLVCYFLQIKDRHNGNIMIDARGHIVHIDFGFMLTNSPGAIKFENAPFKLTEEYLQVICGMKNVQDVTEISRSEGFRFFQELFVLGMLAAQKHHEKITTLVRIMMDGTSMPCMTAGSSIIEGLQQRFALGMPEKQTISHAISLIESSRLSVRSVGYDRFQAYSNGYR